MSVLVDTSVWIDFLCVGPSPHRQEVARLLRQGEAAYVDPIVAELVYGARGERERSVILDLAVTARRFPLGSAAWLAAGDLGRRWRARGRTLSLVDRLLVAVCREHNVPLWTLDADFQPLATAGELTLHAGE